MDFAQTWLDGLALMLLLGFGIARAVACQGEHSGRARADVAVADDFVVVACGTHVVRR